MKTYQLKAAIVRVTHGSKVVSTEAFGDSMIGVPATTDMHFRNGAVAFAYISTLLLEYVDEHKVTLNETIDHWLPSLPESHQVTLKMLTNQTTGYPDFEADPGLDRSLQQRPVPHLDLPGTAEVRIRSSARVRSRHELELLPYELHDLGEDPVDGRQRTTERAPAKEGPRADGLDSDSRPQHVIHPEPRSALVQLNAG